MKGESDETGGVVIGIEAVSSRADKRRQALSALAPVEHSRVGIFRKRFNRSATWTRTDRDGRDIWEALHPENQRLRTIMFTMDLSVQETANISCRSMNTIYDYLTAPDVRKYRRVPVAVIRLLELELGMAKPQWADPKGIRSYRTIGQYRKWVDAMRGREDE